MRRDSLLSLLALSAHWSVPVVAKAKDGNDEGQHRLKHPLASMASPEAASMEHIDDDMLARRVQRFTTFGHVPYVNCFAKEEKGDNSSRYDIAILGAPSDIVSTTYMAATLSNSRAQPPLHMFHDVLITCRPSPVDQARGSAPRASAPLARASPTATASSPVRQPVPLPAPL